ncbi:AfsR/SARP family transcriptional regulator [Allorhizocola rhizosphaerae]|uniref:AfsR/SARP family transcriptional regulator n=1 Tax=Allorhizocola rhizosphaerae TaxID=1872709 RepID=UPI0013C2C5AF|nr:BTAD domain-containing putative transcriptional regulator [Allorhizocola rhizosphaerae]
MDLGPPRQRLAFAVLALEAGRPVRAETLIDRLWDDSPPQRARETLYVYIARLRAVLRDACRLERRSGGYVLDVDPLQVDLHRFESLLADARAARYPDDQKADLLRRSLALWQADPMADLSGRWVDHVRQMLRGKRHDAMQQWAQAELRLGNAATVINPLAELLDAQPFAESLVGLLMQALAGAGRSAEALDRFTEFRRRLAEELGTDPSPELQLIHQAVLRGEGRPLAVARQTVAIAAQLPLDIYGFAGREAEGKQLDEIRDQGAGPLVVIAGTAGVGKTAFAVRWAHANAERFTDGQLFLNLRGFVPSGVPMPPLEALRRLLRGLGVEHNAIPNDLDEAATLYRSAIAGRRILVVLDNAHDVRQVRPLLPGSPTCMVLVTSRVRLGGLQVFEGARLVTLGPLSPVSSEGLLALMLGRERVAADPHVEQLARRCAQLPLALRIAAANLACQPNLTIAAYLERLDRPGALEALRTEGDEQGAVAAAFDVSYSQLSPPAQRVFRLWSLCRGQDFDAHAIAAIAGMPLDAAMSAVDELCTAHLLEQDSRGRYSSHDLLRAYAGHRAETDESQVDIARSSRRLVDFYTDTTYEASPRFKPSRNAAPRDMEHPPVEPLRFADREAAMHWHDYERDAFPSVVELASQRGWHQAAWQLAEVLMNYFSISRHWPQWLATTRAGLVSARATGDPVAVSRILLCLGMIHKQTGDLAAARADWTEALQTATESGRQQLITACHVNLGGLCVVEGDPAAGAEHLRTALADTAYVSVPKFRVVPQINYGCALFDLGDIDAAADSFAAALSAAQQAGDLVHLCHAHHNLAEVALRRNDFETARRHAEQQLRFAQEIEDPLRQAAAWDVLASAVCNLDLALAREHWQRALTLYEQLGHRLAGPLAEWLGRSKTLGPAAISAADNIRRRQMRKMI